MQQLIQLHVSTPWDHLQAYKIWYHTRYICYYLQMYLATMFYKPEDDSMGSKHVAVLISCCIILTLHHCVVYGGQ